MTYITALMWRTRYVQLPSLYTIGRVQHWVDGSPAHGFSVALDLGRYGRPTPRLGHPPDTHQALRGALLHIGWRPLADFLPNMDQERSERQA
jgi:hypothetical protein